MGCHIITAPADVLKKLPALGTKTAAELSLGAVKSFRDDALAAGLQLPFRRRARPNRVKRGPRLGTGRNCNAYLISPVTL